MNKRKLKIIDRKFQFRMTFSIIGIFFLITFVFVLTIGINVYKDNVKINRIINEQKNVIRVQDEINNIMLDNLIAKDDESSINYKIKEKSSKNIALMNSNMELLNELTDRNNDILIIFIIFLVASGFILYPVLIRKTHQISGPIHIMSEYIKDIIEGKYPDIRPLRKNDELKEFYERFSLLVSFIKELDKIKNK